MTSVVLDTPWPAGQNIASSDTFEHPQCAATTTSRGYPVVGRVTVSRRRTRSAVPGTRYPVGGAWSWLRQGAGSEPAHRGTWATPARIPWAAARHRPGRRH